MYVQTLFLPNSSYCDEQSVHHLSAVDAVDSMLGTTCSRCETFSTSGIYSLQWYLKQS